MYIAFILIFTAFELTRIIFPSFCDVDSFCKQLYSKYDLKSSPRIVAENEDEFRSDFRQLVCMIFFDFAYFVFTFSLLFLGFKPFVIGATLILASLLKTVTNKKIEDKIKESFNLQQESQSQVQAIAQSDASLTLKLTKTREMVTRIDSLISSSMLLFLLII